MSNTIKITVIIKINNCCPLITNEPIFKDKESITFGKVLGVGETKYILVYSRKNETPIAVINSDIRGALRNGLYAIFSTKIPKRPVTTIDMISAGIIDILVIVTA